LPAGRALVARFGSIRSIAQATPAELRAVPGIGPRRADAVHRALTRVPLADSASSGIRVAPHDQGVLAVVGVVPAAEAFLSEAEPLVERDRPRVGDAYLECVAAQRVV